MYHLKYFITIYPHIDYLLIDEFIIIFLENYHNVIIHSSWCDLQSSVKQWTYAQAWMRFQNIIVHIIIDDFLSVKALSKLVIYLDIFCVLQEKVIQVWIDVRSLV